MSIDLQMLLNFYVFFVFSQTTKKFSERLKTWKLLNRKCSLQHEKSLSV